MEINRSENSIFAIPHKYYELIIHYGNLWRGDLKKISIVTFSNFFKREARNME